MNKPEANQIGLELKPDFEIPKTIMIGDDKFDVSLEDLESDAYEVSPTEKFIKISKALNAKEKCEVFVRAIFHIMVVSAMPPSEHTERVLNNIMWANYFIFKQTLRS